jgi:uncharacterized protein (TIGR02444 family)
MMNQANHNLRTESWAFALQIYAEPGVAEACLRLQAEAGVDVVMLLMATFAVARRGIFLSPSDIQGMDDACRAWRDLIVQQLRALRVTLKLGPAPAPSPATERLRTHIKAGELIAERLQNDMLADWLQQKGPASRPGTRDELQAVLRSVVMLNLPGPGSRQIDDVSSAIEDIVAAAASIST